MKALFVALLVAMVSAGGYFVGRSGVSVVSAKSIESPYEIPADSAFEKEVTAAERAGLEALKIGDVAKFGDLTADEAIFVDAHGQANKIQVMKNVAAFQLKEYTMDNVQVLQLSPNTGFITYKLGETGVSMGKEFEGQVYVSSIWTKRDGKWLCLFSQETEAR